MPLPATIAMLSPSNYHRKNQPSKKAKTKPRELRSFLWGYISEDRLACCHSTLRLESNVPYSVYLQRIRIWVRYLLLLCCNNACIAYFGQRNDTSNFDKVSILICRECRHSYIWENARWQAKSC